MMTLEWLRRTNSVLRRTSPLPSTRAGRAPRVERGRRGRASTQAGPARLRSGSAALKGSDVMDLLKRKSPIVDEAWEAIDEEARRVLKLHLAARKLIDFSGRMAEIRRRQHRSPEHIEGGPVETSPTRNLAMCAQLVELRAPIFRPIFGSRLTPAGGPTISNLTPVILAAKASREPKRRRSFPASIGPSHRHDRSQSSHASRGRTSQPWPSAVSAAKEVLRMAGVNGPYALAAHEAYDEIIADGNDGYRSRNRIEERSGRGLLGLGPALKEGAVCSPREGATTS